MALYLVEGAQDELLRRLLPMVDDDGVAAAARECPELARNESVLDRLKDDDVALAVLACPGLAEDEGVQARLQRSALRAETKAGTTRSSRKPGAL